MRGMSSRYFSLSESQNNSMMGFVFHSQLAASSDLLLQVLVDCFDPNLCMSTFLDLAEGCRENETDLLAASLRAFSGLIRRGISGLERQDFLGKLVDLCTKVLILVKFKNMTDLLFNNTNILLKQTRARILHKYLSGRLPRSVLPMFLSCGLRQPMEVMVRNWARNRPSWYKYL